MLSFARAFSCFIIACYGRRVQTQSKNSNGVAHGDQGQNGFASALKRFMPLRVLPDTSAAWQVGLSSSGRGVVASRLSRGTPNLVAKALSELTVGQECTATVEAVEKYGVFVDIGVKETLLLHVNEIEGGHDALEKLAVGDTIVCWVRAIRLGSSDSSLQLTRKQRKDAVQLTMQKPGKLVPFAELEVGEEYKGIASKVMEYGILVDIGAETGLALLHANSLCDLSLEEVSVGDAISCWIKSIDLETGEFKLTTYKPGTRVPLAEFKAGQMQSGVIRRVTAYGAFVDIGAEQQALLNMRELEGGEKELEKLSAGDKISCCIRSVDLAKGVVDLFVGKEDRGPLKEFKVGQECSGVVKKKKSHGALIDVGVETGKPLFLHESEVEEGRDGLMKLGIGDKITCWITAIDLEKEKGSVTALRPGTSA